MTPKELEVVPGSGCKGACCFWLIVLMQKSSFEKWWGIPVSLSLAAFQSRENLLHLIGTKVQCPVGWVGGFGIIRWFRTGFPEASRLLAFRDIVRLTAWRLPVNLGGGGVKDASNLSKIGDCYSLCISIPLRQKLQPQIDVVFITQFAGITRLGRIFP